MHIIAAGDFNVSVDNLISENGRIVTRREDIGDLLGAGIDHEAELILLDGTGAQAEEAIDKLEEVIGMYEEVPVYIITDNDNRHISGHAHDHGATGVVPLQRFLDWGYLLDENDAIQDMEVAYGFKDNNKVSIQIDSKAELIRSGVLNPIKRQLKTASISYGVALQRYGALGKRSENRSRRDGSLFMFPDDVIDPEEVARFLTVSRGTGHYTGGIYVFTEHPEQYTEDFTRKTNQHADGVIAIKDIPTTNFKNLLLPHGYLL